MRIHLTTLMLLTLFKIFFKIGLFTFGGGYGMISLIHDECIDKNKFITHDEFLNVVSVAESTPGPIAINMATYIGYKICGISGAVVATLGVSLPSLIIIFIIAKYLKNFLQIKIISYAFFGIMIAVSIIIVKTSYKLIVDEYKNSDKKHITIFIFILYLIVLFIINLCDIKINTVFLILFAMMLGIILYNVRIKI